MYRLSCKDLGSVQCDHVIEAETIEEAKQILVEHAQSAHADLLDSMSEAELLAMNEKVEELLRAQEQGNVENV